MAAITQIYNTIKRGHEMENQNVLDINIYKKIFHNKNTVQVSYLKANSQV